MGSFIEAHNEFETRVRDERKPKAPDKRSRLAAISSDSPLRNHELFFAFVATAPEVKDTSAVADVEASQLYSDRSIRGTAQATTSHRSSDKDLIYYSKKEPHLTGDKN
eukprot:IDg10634t1